jgi:hypothetical protein
MFRRTIGLCFALLIASAARAQDTSPALAVWTSSLDGFLSQSQTLMGQLGLADAAAKFDQAVTAKLGGKRFAGIDGSRPLGAFLQFDPDPSGALLVPITGEREFLDLLERLEIKAAKDADGTYRLAAPVPVPVYMKLSPTHAWITVLNKSALAARIDAARVFPPQPKFVAGRLRIDRIPKDARQLTISHIEEMLQESFKKNTAASTPAQKAFVEAGNQAIARLVAQFLEQGQELAFDVAFDGAGKTLTSRATLTPLPGTALAKSLADSGRRTSVFAKSDASQPLRFRAGINAALPDGVATAFSALVAESFKDAAAGLQDPAKKKQTQELLSALVPTLKAGEFDAILAFAGPNPDKLGVVAGLKVAQGDRIAALFKTLAEEARAMMTDAEKAKVMLDADAAGPTKIHRFALTTDKGTLQQAHDILGEAILSLAFRPDALVVGVGDGSDAAIKRVAQPASPAIAPLAFAMFDVAALSPLFSPTPKLKALAGESFRAPGDGLCQLTVTGGNELSVQFTIRTPALRFFAASRGERTPAKD